MATIQYPTTLPDFKLGKSRAQQQTFRTSQPFNGPLFVEKVTDESPVTWEVSILCIGQIQARQFQAFLRAVNNGQPFDKKILTEEGAIDHEVRFVDMPLQPIQLSDVIWEYSGLVYAVALVQPDDAIDDLLIANWLQDASIIDNALNNLWGFGLQTEPVVFNPILWMPLLSNLDVAIGTGPATFVNASANRSYVDRLGGLIKYAAANEARFESEGALIEGASTNSLTQSDTTLAQLSSGSLVTDATSFSQFANGIQFDSSSASSLAYKNFATVAATEYTISMFVIMDDLLAPSLGVSTATGDFVLVINNLPANLKPNVQLINAAQGLYRVSASLVSTGASSSNGVFRSASQVGRGFKVTGYQVEALPFASSYNATLATAVTRTADDLSVPTAGNFNESEGCISFTADVIGDLGAAQYLLDISDGTGNNRYTIIRTFDLIRLSIVSGGLSQATITTAFTMNVGTQYKIAVNYKDNDVELFVDTVSIGTDVSVIVPTGLTVVNIGKQVSGDELFGHTKQLKFFDRNLTPAEIADL